MTQDETDVAYIFNQYHLISCPWSTTTDRLVGVITIDDAMIVLDEEHEEDMLRLAGVNDESNISDNAFATARRRLPWLVINLFTASMSAIVISRFEDTIATLVILAALMPIVASTGGIAGTQSLAVSVRALATRDLTSANARRVVLRELGAGLLNGSGACGRPRACGVCDLRRCDAGGGAGAGDDLQSGRGGARGRARAAGARAGWGWTRRLPRAPS